MIDSLQIIRYFLTEETAGERMIAIAAQRDRSPILDGHHHATGVGAIMRANRSHGFKFLKHSDILTGGLSEGYLFLCAISTKETRSGSRETSASASPSGSLTTSATGLLRIDRALLAGLAKPR